MQIFDLKDKRIALLGFGKSNSELFKYIYDYTKDIFIFDQKQNDLKNECLYKDTICYSGKDCFKNLAGFDYIFRSPAIRPDDPNILREVKRGAVLTSEIELFISECKAKIIGVTGSDGKTTTSTLIYEILKKSRKKVYLGGNIGTPLINLLHEIDSDSIVVLELSSFQLMTFDEKIDISVVTNLSPNHLDYHTSLDEYLVSKKNIARYSERVVLNKKDKISMEYFSDLKKSKIVYFNSLKGIYYKNKYIYIDGSPVIETSKILIKGLHNIENLMAAIAAVKDISDIESIRNAAYSFKGVEHRIEYVDEIDGVIYINHSIASSPKRTIVGLKTFKRKVILIAGGQDKGISYDNIGTEIKKHVKSLILLGQTKDVILKSVLEVDKDFDYNITDTLEEAIMIAKSKAKQGDIVFFSPASTSFDMFENFEERGKLFKAYVKKKKEK